jgi:hypothetical protein
MAARMRSLTSCSSNARSGDGGSDGTRAGGSVELSAFSVAESGDVC